MVFQVMCIRIRNEEWESLNYFRVVYILEARQFALTIMTAVGKGRGGGGGSVYDTTVVMYFIYS